MQKISEIIEEGKYPIREFYSYKFGSKKRCKEIIIETFNEVDKTFTKFEWLPEYDQVVDWMYDTKGKGLALFGSIGRGKTVINSFILPVLFYERYRKFLTPQIADGLTRDSLKKWAHCIDDIGTEEIINDYGTKTDMVSYAINDAEYYLKPLFLTSNLTEGEMIKRYGIHMYDRIKRLCRIVIFTGKSFRQ